MAKTLLSVLLVITICLLSVTSGLDCTRCPPATCELQNPRVIDSVNGVLKVTLVANIATVCVGNMQVQSIVYNDSYVPPLLRVNRGDRLELTIINKLIKGEITNTHFHGLSVSPLGSGDDVLIHIEPGEKHLYNLTIPMDHHAGLQWYHSHAHGNAQKQVLNGLSGGLIVNGLLNDFPDNVRNVTEKVFLMKETPLIDTPNGRGVLVKVLSNNYTITTVNGILNPVIHMKQGELQLWRFAGLSPDRYFNVTFGNSTFYTISVDGNLRRNALVQTHIEVEPGGRREAFVYGPPAGTYEVVAEFYVVTPEGGWYYRKVLATVISEASNIEHVFLPLNGSSYEHHKSDLRDGPIANRRTIVFGRGEGTFLVDKKVFNIKRTDVTVRFGTVEEWTIINDTPEMHTFHIHQMPFQVTAIDGVRLPYTGLQDTVNLAYAEEGQARRNITVVIPFTDPLIIGKFVYHCHIMFHEDRGMMAVIRVLPEGVTEWTEDAYSSSGAGSFWPSFLLGSFIVHFLTK